MRSLLKINERQIRACDMGALIYTVGNSSGNGTFVQPALPHYQAAREKRTNNNYCWNEFPFDLQQGAFVSEALPNRDSVGVCSGTGAIPIPPLDA